MTLRTTAALALSLAALGSDAQVSSPFITITAENANGIGSFVVNLGDPGQLFTPNGGVLFDSGVLGAAFNGAILSGSGETIATITQLVSPAFADDLSTSGVDPRLGLVFAINAGALDTTITVSSTLVTPPVAIGPNAILSAAAAFTVSDLNNNGVIASSIGLESFASFSYNGGGTVFADLVNGPIVAGPIGSNSAFASLGPIATGATVSDFQIDSLFRISAGDAVSGNLIFSLIPAPSTGVLIALGGFMTARRRR